MRLSIRQLWYLGSLSCGLSSCSVYAPMLPVAPQLRAKGQAEVQATTFLNTRWEAGATYSPVRHLLVHAAGGLRRDNPADTAYFRISQYEVGLGGYVPLGPDWLLSGLGGYGQARSTRGYLQLNRRTGDSEQVDLRSSYHRVFGELAVSHQVGSEAVLGAGYRLAQVTFDQLTSNGTPLALRRMPRQEFLVFGRFGVGEGVLRWLQLQTSFGVTSVAGRSYHSPQDPYDYGRIEASNLLVGLTLVVRPHLFKPPARGAN